LSRVLVEADVYALAETAGARKLHIVVRGSLGGRKFVLYDVHLLLDTTPSSFEDPKGPALVFFFGLLQMNVPVRMPVAVCAAIAGSELGKELVAVHGPVHDALEGLLVLRHG